MSRPVPRVTPRRAFLSLARATLTVVVLVWVYYILPLDLQPGPTVLILTGGLVGLALVVAWQIRGIMRARQPGLRAFESLALTIPAFLLLFSTGYYMVAVADPGAFTEPLTRTDALYFTITVFATVGFGDIAPVAQALRVVVAVQMLVDLIVLGFVLRAMLDAVGRARSRQAAAPEQ